MSTARLIEANDKESPQLSLVPKTDEIDEKKATPMSDKTFHERGEPRVPLIIIRKYYLGETILWLFLSVC